MFPKDNVYSFTQHFCWLQSQPTGHPNAKKKINRQGLRSNIVGCVSQITTPRVDGWVSLPFNMSQHSFSHPFELRPRHAMSQHCQGHHRWSGGEGRSNLRVTAWRCSLGHESPRGKPNGDTDPELSPGPARGFRRWLFPRCVCRTWGNAV